jgi:hypothetical protein
MMMANIKSGATPPMIKLMRYEFSEVGGENQRATRRRDPDIFIDYVEQADEQAPEGERFDRTNHCSNEKYSCNAAQSNIARDREQSVIKRRLQKGFYGL